MSFQMVLRFLLNHHLHHLSSFWGSLYFIVNSAASEHRCRLIRIVPFAQATGDSLLVFAQGFGVGFLHSKCAFLVVGGMISTIVSANN
jgi:hypothetical protein